MDSLLIVIVFHKLVNKAIYLYLFLLYQIVYLFFHPAKVSVCISSFESFNVSTLLKKIVFSIEFGP